MDQFEVVRKFADHIKWLLDGLLSKGDDDSKSELSIAQCEDAISIVKPIANNGGHQTFTTINGDVHLSVLNITGHEARRITNNAEKVKARLKGTKIEIAQRVPLVWKRLDSATGKVDGSSPDKAIIEELDPRPRPVFFTDEMVAIKKTMIEDEDNAFKKVYFVDVQISRVGDKIVSYRVIAYHGEDDL